ncbi:MAG TPA: heterodisulfide reductase-related iron-sulfur binding cluster [Methylomirabilota bacterium]|nr:heterodisulfide reductase-related iron-sulfur binding cluster [Methylomirabilota bacterium]
MTYDLLPALTPLIMYIVLSGFAAVFLYGVYRRFRLYFRGVTRFQLDRLGERVQSAFVNAFAQRKVVKKPVPGLMHLFIYVGFVVLLIGTTLVFLDYDIWKTFFHQQILVGNFYLFYETSLDAFGLVAIAGLLIAIYRRVVMRPANLPSSRDDVFIYSALIVILVTGYIMEGIRLAVDNPPWAPWSFVGYQVSLLLSASSGKELVNIYPTLWWFHALLAFTAFAAIPYTKLFHLITSPFNALLADQKPVGQLNSPFDLRQLVESGNFDVKIGASAIGDFSWRERLSFDSCTSCGRCSNACPATAAETPLSPMHLILKLRSAMITEQSDPVIGSVIDQEELWACTTCRACVQECPVLIDHIDSIVDMRRHLVGEGKLDRAKRDLLNNLSNSANPYGLPTSDRLNWAQGLDVKTVKDQPEFEILYWVGCSGSYDPRNQSVSRAMIKILNAAKVRFSVLGNEEKCNCEVARRMGEEGRFQQSALDLIQVFEKYKVKTIITQCPHCFNTFKNEYPEFGASFQVIHHTQFIANLIKAGRLNLRKGSEDIITFHDPCYLGRYNSIYDTPRSILSSLGPVSIREMHRHRESSFCCGAGGANFWYKVDQKKRINQIRFEEAKGTKSNILATACPFCTSMFEDAASSSDSTTSPRVKDVAELVADLIDSSHFY